MAPYSFTITRALETKVQVIWETSVFFDILLRQHEKRKAKLRVNFLAFPSVKFRKIWQTVKKYFTLVGALRPVFWQR